MQFIWCTSFIALISETIIANPIPQSNFEMSFPLSDVLDSQTVSTIDPGFYDNVSDNLCENDPQSDKIFERENGGAEGFCHLRQESSLNGSKDPENDLIKKPAVEQETQTDPGANTTPPSSDEQNICSKETPFDVHLCCRGNIMGRETITFRRRVDMWVEFCAPSWFFFFLWNFF